MDQVDRKLRVSILKEFIDSTQAKRIEASCWNAANDLISYSQIFFRIVMNIDPDSFINLKDNDTTLLDAIKNNQIDLDQIAFMSELELNEKKNNHVIKYIDKQRQQKIKKKSTELFVCKKCRKNKCEYVKIQTRGLDEGYTLFIHCLVCDNRWSTSS